ncbi:hypothetical protein [Methylobacterium sp. 1030]|uniref:hypothetical protein n=1 Tax=Methylobacterium sp. 1030 TaxID=3156404 RepID=UPI003394E782
MSDDPKDDKTALDIVRAFAVAVQNDRPMALLFEVDEHRMAFTAKKVTEGFVISALNALATRYPVQFKAFVEVWQRNNNGPVPPLQ